MENYYEEIIQEIEEMINNGDYGEALVVLKKELSMPYIPEESETRFKSLYHDLKYKMSDRKNSNEKNIDDILNGLKGSSEQQLAACSQLTNRNLRECVNEINDYLSSDPYPEAAALLVESIAEQEIQEGFTWNKEGIEYTFYGDSLTPCAKSKGFLKANQLLKEWLEKNPDMYEMAKSILIHDVYLFLPLSYEEDEGESLAFDVFENICQMMGREDLIQPIKDKLGYSNQKFS
jgi:hypothetical protein